MENEQIDVRLAEGKSFLEGGCDETDLPPEYCQYRDEGCEFAGSCLACPLPRCVLDMPGGKQRWLKGLRDRDVVRRFTAEGSGIKELALIFDVSQRTIQRILKRTKDESNLYSRAIKEA